MMERVEIWQDGLMVAAMSGPDGSCGADASHYAMQYGQDGPIEVRVFQGQAAELRELELMQEFGEDEPPQEDGYETDAAGTFKG